MKATYPVLIHFLYTLLAIVVANLILMLWEYRSRWHYSIDKVGIFLVTGSPKHPARRRLLTWHKADLSMLIFLIGMACPRWN